MSVHNKVVWSEGLFLQPQHFQQQDRYFERYVESAVPVAHRAQLGFHRDRDRARLSEHRQVRAAASVGRVPGRHAVSDAGRRPAAGADRHRRERPRSAPVPGGAAAPRRRARGRIGPSETDGLVRHEIRELQARDATAGGGDTALLEVAALRTRLLLASDVTAGVCDDAARAPGRMPGGQAGRPGR